MHEVSLVHALFDHADRALAAAPALHAGALKGPAPHAGALNEGPAPHADRAPDNTHARDNVRLLSVRIGVLAGVEKELFVTAFEIVRHERGYGAASLELLEARGRELILERMELEVSDV